MPWIDVIDDNRKKIGEAHLCMGKPSSYCIPCWKNDRLRQLSSKLCDFKLPSGATCDKPICDFHATSGGKNIDYCPEHKHAAPQPALPLEVA